MPPSGHSSSSHSSHSSSSHSSSSHSFSSSRSSSSSSRSYSSSSRSSGSRSSASSSRSFGSGSFGSSKRPSPNKGPSQHSASSHSSRPVSQPSSGRSAPLPRTRHNQPTGFIPVGKVRPSYYRGARHDYIYYPESWVDASTGTSYQSGYYDENGQRYDDVSFEKNGTYENVVCTCEYCGQDAVVNLSADDAAVKSVNCPNCGAPMSIRSQLDTAAETTYTPPENTHDYHSEESLQNFRDSVQKRKRRRGGWVVVLALLVLLGIGRRIYGRMREGVGFQSPSTNYTQLYEEYDPIPLVKAAEHVYAKTSDAQSADKTLVWDSEYESYYDAESDCWLWYNTDMNPPVWQYWYEGISSDYGDYGWMEHDADGWWVEASYDNWILLPQTYDASGLWYIEG